MATSEYEAVVIDHVKAIDVTAIDHVTVFCEQREIIKTMPFLRLARFVQKVRVMRN